MKDRFPDRYVRDKLDLEILTTSVSTADGSRAHENHLLDRKRLRLASTPGPQVGCPVFAQLMSPVFILV